MGDRSVARPQAVKGGVRVLAQRDLPLLRDHLLRLDREGRRDRFNGAINDDFIESYAVRCADDCTLVIAYFEKGMLQAAAELHPSEASLDMIPEIAFSVEAHLRRQGVGSILFRRLIDEARTRGYCHLRITTGAQNEAMRRLVNKYGARLTFRHGESSGTIDVKEQSSRRLPPRGVLDVGTSIEAAQAFTQFNRAYWRFWLRLYGWASIA